MHLPVSPRDAEKPSRAGVLSRFGMASFVFCVSGCAGGVPAQLQLTFTIIVALGFPLLFPASVTASFSVVFFAVFSDGPTRDQ